MGNIRLALFIISQLPLSLHKYLMKLIRIIKRKYQTMSSEDYLLNQRSSQFVKTRRQTILYPLSGANMGHGTSDQFHLVGVPYGYANQPYQQFDSIHSVISQTAPQLVFLQFDPCRYVARQRFLSHKCALNQVEDYKLQTIEQTDPLKLISWEQAVVDLMVLDMLRQNKIHSNLKLVDSFYTYSYPYLRKTQSKQMTQTLSQSINKNIVGNFATEFSLINKALFACLMGKHRVILGDMPEPLFRMILGNNLSIGQLTDIFKSVIHYANSLLENLTIKQSAIRFMPHIFQSPKDLYMTALIKQVFQATTCAVAFVGIPHFNPIKEYWIPPPSGINFSQATRIPPRIEGESDQVLIQKQAMLQILMDTKLWGQQYISNPFPYLVSDITKISKKDYMEMKSCFKLFYKKWSMFRQRNVAKESLLESRKEQMIEQKPQRLSKQQFSKVREGKISG